MPVKIGILGAAGATGKAAAREFAHRGWEFRVVGRTESRLREAFGSLMGVEYLAADLETRAGARRAVEGLETVVFAVGLPYHEFHRYPPLMRTLMAVAKEAGVKRFLLVTNIYPYGLPNAPLIREDHPLRPNSFKGRMRLEQEQIVQASGIDWIVLRLPDFFGPDAELSYGRMIFEAAIARKAVDLFAPVDTPHQFVFTTDVGPVVAGLVERPDGWNEVYHFAGSGLITVEDFARKVYAAAGEPYKRRLAAKWMIQAMGLFNRTMREFPEMHYLQTNPVNLADGKLEAHLGGLRRTAYDDGIALTLGTMREHPFAPMKQ